MAKAGRIQQATNAAREQVIVEMCRPPADLMEDDNDDLDRLQMELLSPGVAYYLLPWIEEEPDPEEDEDMYDLYWSLIGHSLVDATNPSSHIQLGVEGVGLDEERRSRLGLPPDLVS